MILVPFVPASVVVGAFAVSEAVQLELIKLAATIVAAVAAVYGAKEARKNRRQIREVQREQRRRRTEVRDPERERVVVAEHPPKPEPGAARRHTDPPPEV